MSPHAAPPVSLLRLATPDGRSLDVYQAGPRDGMALLFHVGTPGAPIPYPPALAQMAERGLRYVAFSRPGYGSSTRRPGRSVADIVDDTVLVLDHAGVEAAVTIGWSGGGPHLFDDEGHLSLAVTRFGEILDGLIGTGTAGDAHG